MTEATDGNGHSIRFRYNNQNRLEARIDQVGEMEIWNYDAEGRPCRYTDRNGTQTAYQYNMYGNLTRRWNVGVEGNENTAVSESYGYTPEGRLSYAIGGGMRYDYVYDEAGHLMEKQASGRTLLSYEYNQDNQLSARTDYTGKRTEYRYNEMGQLEEIIDNGVSQAVYDYTPEGRIRHMTSGYLESGYQYDTDGNMTALQTLLGDDLLVDNQYQYDRNGNCIEKATLSGTTSYTYDSMNRLTEAVYPWGREVLGYDYADNRISREFFEKTGYNKEQFLLIYHLE